MSEKVDYLQEIKNAVESRELPTLYFNGFTATIGTGDVLIVLKQQNEPVLILNVSYTIAKTLAIKLGDIVTHFEQKTGNIIMTTDEIQSKLIESKDDDVKD